MKLINVEPVYTLKTCSNCGQIIKANRQDELCGCGLLIDAGKQKMRYGLKQGTYTPINKEKYIGLHLPKYRSRLGS